MMLTGINIEATLKLAQSSTIPGSSPRVGPPPLADVERLCAVQREGIAGVICGCSNGPHAAVQLRADELVGGCSAPRGTAML